MKLTLLTCCLSICFLLEAQTFSWNDDTDASSDLHQEASIDYTGQAHFYPDYYEGNPTALGEVFHQNLLTAAHKKLPLGTIVKVTRLDNGLSTTVRINDRGAYCDGCVIDLSKAAAQQIELLAIGQTRVKLTVIGSSSTNPNASEPVEEYASASINEDSRFTSRGVDQNTISNYQTSSPIPNTYPSNQTTLTARTPITNKVATSNDTNTPPKVQLKGNSSSADQVNVIDVPVSPFAVQLGAYSKYANAERHVLKLQQQGFNNIFLLKEQRLSEAPLNRVIVAPFLSVDDAQEYVEDLAEYHQIKGLVFQAKLVEVED